MKHHHKSKTSREAKDFISHKIELLMREGRSRKQAIAIAMDMGRRKGFKVPKKRKGRKNLKKK